MIKAKSTHAQIIVRTEKGHAYYSVGPFENENQTIEWCDAFREFAGEKHDDMSAYPDSVLQVSGKSKVKTIKSPEQIIEEIWHELHPLW